MKYVINIFIEFIQQYISSVWQSPILLKKSFSDTETYSLEKLNKFLF